MSNSNNQRRPFFDWRLDLEHSRRVPKSQLQGFQMVLNWFEAWRLQRELKAERGVAVRFWKEAIASKERESWQLDQWAKAMDWYLRWLKFTEEQAQEPRSLSERLYQAVMNTGGRRGLALRTRKTYAKWAARFGLWVGSVEGARSHERGADWLNHLVTVEKLSYSTQKQALNALVFFFREVCGDEEVVLDVRLRKTKTRIPVVLSSREVFGLIEKNRGKVSGACPAAIWGWFALE